MSRESVDDESDLLLPAGNQQTHVSHFKKELKEELKALMQISIPVIITNLTAFLILTESIIMTGQLTKFDLDACALANSIINVFGMAIATGLCTACDTYFSQMYGSPHIKSIGMMLQKSILIIMLFPIVLIAIHINLGPLLHLMGQDVIVAKQTELYLRIFSPGLIFVFIYLILTRYLQSQKKVLPPMLIGLLVNGFNILSQYLTIYVFNFGFDASPVCQAVSFFLMCFIQLLYIKYSGIYKETWDGFTNDAFMDWRDFLKLAIAGAAMVVMECFCFEISTILSGILGPTELAAQTVIFQLETITFMISFGVGVAVNIQVGNALGSNDARKARLSYRCGLLVMLLAFALELIFELSLMNVIPTWFTNDREAQKIATELIPLIVGIQFFDCIGTVTMGALRGCGRQKLCVLLIFCSYYVLGQPIGISLAFAAGMKVKGLWVGLLISLAICVPVAFIYTNFIQNWEQQAADCQNRINHIAITRRGDNLDEFSEEKVPRHFSNSGLPNPGSRSRKLSRSFSFSKSGKIFAKIQEIESRQFRKAIFSTIFIYLAALLILIVGLLFSIFYTHEIYLPLFNLTSTISPVARIID